MWVSQVAAAGVDRHTQVMVPLRYDAGPGDCSLTREGDVGKRTPDAVGRVGSSVVVVQRHGKVLLSRCAGSDSRPITKRLKIRKSALSLVRSRDSVSATTPKPPRPGAHDGRINRVVPMLFLHMLAKKKNNKQHR